MKWTYAEKATKQERKVKRSMPRRARLDATGALHHVMVRGINKAAIFSGDQDRQKFLKRLGENIDSPFSKNTSDIPLREVFYKAS